MPDPTAAIVDSQSVRAAANIPRSPAGWDGGKKVGGRKRHLVVDSIGLVLAIAVTAASVQDRDAAVGLLQRLRNMYFFIRLVWADGGYAGSLVDWAREKPRLILHIVKRTDDTTDFVVLPRRWVVERTLSWLMRTRRLVHDRETVVRGLGGVWPRAELPRLVPERLPEAVAFARRAVCGFLKVRPTLIHRLPSTETRRGGSWPSPRSWCRRTPERPHPRTDERGQFLVR